MRYSFVFLFLIMSPICKASCLNYFKNSSKQAVLSSLESARAEVRNSYPIRDAEKRKVERNNDDFVISEKDLRQMKDRTEEAERLFFKTVELRVKRNRLIRRMGMMESIHFEKRVRELRELNSLLERGEVRAATHIVEPIFLEAEMVMYRYLKYKEKLEDQGLTSTQRIWYERKLKHARDELAVKYVTYMHYKGLIVAAKTSSGIVDPLSVKTVLDENTGMIITPNTNIEVYNRTASLVDQSVNLSYFSKNFPELSRLKNKYGLKQAKKIFTEDPRAMIVMLKMHVRQESWNTFRLAVLWFVEVAQGIVYKLPPKTRAFVSDAMLMSFDYFLQDRFVGRVEQIARSGFDPDKKFALMIDLSTGLGSIHSDFFFQAFARKFKYKDLWLEMYNIAKSSEEYVFVLNQMNKAKEIRDRMGYLSDTTNPQVPYKVAVLTTSILGGSSLLLTQTTWGQQLIDSISQIILLGP